MHTAMRLRWPSLASSSALVAWVDGLAAAVPQPAAPRPDLDMPASGEGAVSVHLGRGHFRLPARHLLPPIDRFARLAIGHEERLAGYVEASHGCTFHCRHCPVPTVYDGRIRLTQARSASTSGAAAPVLRPPMRGSPDHDRRFPVVAVVAATLRAGCHLGIVSGA